MTAKLLFYTHGLVDGGAERLWSCLASAMKARGYDVIFAQDFEAEENRANLDASIPLFTLGRNHFRSVKTLAEVLRREKPDVVLASVGGSNLKLMLAKALAKSPVKTIITYHGFAEWKTGLLSLATYLGLPVLSTRADATVAVSDGLTEQLIKRWGSRQDKTVCIHNPVFLPPNIRAATEAELKARPETVLAVGRFVREKDFLTLIRAFGRLDRPNARLVILGKGPDEPKMLAEIKKLGLENRVSLPGYSKEPWKYYESARCFALSSNSEPFGNVIVEALAYGLPVVATACSGPQEILQHGQFGRIVAVGDDLQLSHAIAATLDNPGDPSLRRQRANDFSFDVRIPAYEALVRKVLGQEPLAQSTDATVHTLNDRRQPRPAA